MTDDVITRVFRTQLHTDVEDADGRTIVGRIVPYGEVAVVADGPGHRYQEMICRGAFAGNVEAPHRVLLDFEHGRTLSDKVGHAVELREDEDALRGVFRTTLSGNGPLVMELVNEGVFQGLSIEADVRRTTRRRDGVVMRTRLWLRGVALCREPAYPGAMIEAVRTHEPDVEPSTVLDLSEYRAARDTALDDRLRRLGLLSAVESNGSGNPV